MAKTTRHMVKLVGLLTLSTLGLAAVAQHTSNRDGASGRDDVDEARVSRRGDADEDAIRNRGDIRHLPRALKERIGELAARPFTFRPITAFSEASQPSQLFQYYLLDTKHFQPNVFTSVVPGINDRRCIKRLQRIAPGCAGP